MNTLPRWARLLDALGLVCLLVGIALVLSPARVRLDLGFTVVSLGTPWPQLLLAVLAVGGRHWWLPRPHLGERIVAWRSKLGTPAVVLSARMLLTTRVMVLLAGYVATLIIGLPPSINQISQEPLRGLPARWDATWYMEIARAGYRYDPRLGPDVQQSIVFFPLYPMLIRTLAAFTTPERPATMQVPGYIEMRLVHLAWSGLLISLLAFACALVVVYRWAELHAGSDAAAGTVALLSTYPFAVYFSAPYTEALFLLLACGACYAFERGRLFLAGAAGLLAGLTRPNGVMVSLVLGLLALAPLRRRERGWLRRMSAGLLAAAMPAVGMLLYSTYVYRLTGNPFAWVEAQVAWGRELDTTAKHYGWIWQTIADEGLLAYLRALPAEAVQVVALVFSLGLAWPVARRIGPAYALFMLANLLPPTVQGGVLSLGRFTATLFPQFLALALMIPPERRTGWIIAFAIAQGLVATVFFTWEAVCTLTGRMPRGKASSVARQSRSCAFRPPSAWTIVERLLHFCADAPIRARSEDTTMKKLHPDGTRFIIVTGRERPQRLIVAFDPLALVPPK